MKHYTPGHRRNTLITNPPCWSHGQAWLGWCAIPMKVYLQGRQAHCKEALGLGGHRIPGVCMELVPVEGVVVAVGEAVAALLGDALQAAVRQYIALHGASSDLQQSVRSRVVGGRSHWHVSQHA